MQTAPHLVAALAGQADLLIYLSSAGIMGQPAVAHAAQQAELDRATIEAGGVAAWARATARRHGIVALSEPIDLFAEAVSRLSAAEVELDPIERLLLAIERAGIIDGHRGVLLHAAYLRQRR